MNKDARKNNIFKLAVKLTKIANENMQSLVTSLEAQGFSYKEFIKYETICLKQRKQLKNELKHLSDYLEGCFLNNQEGDSNDI